MAAETENTLEQMDELKEMVEAGKSDTRDYHRQLVSMYGYVPKWAGPFHYCNLCRGLYPNMCSLHG